MPKPKKQKQELFPQDDPSADPETGAAQTDLLPDPGNGHHEEPDLVETTPEEPAQVQLTIKGSDRSARAAAKRFGGEQPKPLPVATPANDTEPPDDNTDELMANGQNMVLVRRTFPKTVDMNDGSKRRCAIKLPDRYDCPTTREKIEADVFTRYGGSEYKCTIHPATTNGERELLGYFTIEHPNQDEPPCFPDDPPEEQPFDPRTSVNTTGADPTMHETDGLAKLRADAERRLDRARVRKEMKELEAEAKRLEEEIDGTDRKPPAPVVASGDSDEVKKLREQLAEKDRQLAEKKVNDRFDSLENSIKALAAAVAAKPAEKSGESETMKFILKKMDTDSAQISALTTALTTVKATPAPAHSSEGDFDKFLDRVTKLNAITGGGPNKPNRGLSSLEERLIDMSFDRLTGGEGGEGGGEGEDDVAKLAVKEFAPILKSFVDKKMTQQSDANGGAPLTPEQVKKIQLEAAQAAAKKVQEDLALQGLGLATGENGRLIAIQIGKTKQPVVPPRHANPGTRVVSETRNAQGVTKKISIKPDDLTGRPKPAEEAPAAEETKGGETVPTKGVFPMLGENGSTLKIEFPIRPGELKYDRKYSTNFILDGIRSEIRQGLPQKAATDQKIESYVIGDAIEFLDDELLDQLDNVESGEQLEALLGPWGDAPKIAEIKKAGEDEVVASYLRKLVKSIQREWQREKATS